MSVTFTDFMRQLPESTNAWNCRWFLVIVYVSLWLVGLGLTVLPGVIGSAAVVLGLLSLLVALVTRQRGVSCEV